MQRISSEIEVNAPIELVWEVIGNLNTYNEWNSQFSIFSGSYKKGDRVRMRFSPLNNAVYNTHPQIHKLEYSKEIGWHKLTLFPYLVDGEYSYQLESVDSETTSIKYSQEFKGVLYKFLKKLSLFRAAKMSCIKMNAELKNRIELLNRERSEVLISA